MILKDNNKLITFTFPPYIVIFYSVYITQFIQLASFIQSLKKNTKKTHKCFLSNILAHLPQEYLAHRLQRTGIEPPTF